MISSYVFLSLLLLYFGGLTQAWAVPTPLRDPQKLVLPVANRAFRVKTAKVVLVDYPLLRRDFPSLLKNLSDSEIDSWLLNNTALMSETQIQKGVEARTNTPIDADLDHPIEVYRPQDYGRGFVFEVGQNRSEHLLIDTKGVGAENPTCNSGHSNGLSGLPNMVHEYAMEKLVHKIFQHSRSGFDTIETYAVLDLGFFINEAGYVEIAGSVLRQAHQRFMHADDRLHHYQISDLDAKRIEKVLRRYGVTSTGIRFLQTLGRVESRVQDLQGSTDGALVDFGPFMATNLFDAPLRGVERDSKGHCKILLNANYQPDPALAVLPEVWGYKINPDFKLVGTLSTWMERWSHWVSMGNKTKEELMEFLNQIYKLELDHWEKSGPRHSRRKGF